MIYLWDSGFKTSCHHLRATSMGFLLIITQYVWEGRTTHARGISQILEKVWIFLFVKNKKVGNSFSPPWSARSGCTGKWPRALAPTTPTPPLFITLAASNSCSFFSNKVIHSHSCLSTDNPTNLLNPWILYFTHWDASNLPSSISKIQVALSCKNGSTMFKGVHSVGLPSPLSSTSPNPAHSAQVDLSLNLALVMTPLTLNYPFLSTPPTQKPVAPCYHLPVLILSLSSNLSTL